MKNLRKAHPLVKGLGIAAIVVFGLVTAVCLAFVFGYFVMLLWNWLMPSIFNLKAITYWQAFGLVLLARLLFGSLNGHHSERHALRHPRCKDEDWKVMDGWRSWKYYDEWWKEQGKKSFEDYVETKTIPTVDGTGD